MTKKPPDDPLSPLREKIDSMDRQIVELLHKRYEIVHKVGHVKRSRGEPIFVPEREKNVYERIERLNHGRIPASILKGIYREIMSGAIAMEKPQVVAYLGPEASYSQLASISKFGRAVNYTVQPTIQDVFREVESGRADYGCVPVENSTEGVVNGTLDNLITAQCRICAEVHIHIQHCLLSRFPREKIRVIYSHPQVLGQCRVYLANHFPNAALVETLSSTSGVQRALNEPNSAAIGSSLAAERYEIDLLERGIEDAPENTTRFLVLGLQQPKYTGDDKTSLCFGIKDRVGALYDALLAFKNHAITMTMIESRPSKRRNWEYLFFLDIIGHETEAPIEAAIAELSEQALFVRVLGSYPQNHFIANT